jgi:hypothetical protein
MERTLMRIDRRLLALLLCFALAAPVFAQIAPLEDLAAFPSGPLEITGGK